MKILKKLTLLILTCGQFAQAKTETKSVQEYLALATAHTVNELKTVDNFLQWLAPSITKDELKRTKEFLQEIGIREDQKFPQMKSKKNIAYFDSTNTIAYKDNFILINDKKFELKKVPFDQLLKNICTQLRCNTKISLLSFMLPEANASISGSLAAGLLGLVAGGTLGYYIGSNNNGTYNPYYSNNIGNMYLGAELAQFYSNSNNNNHNNSQIVCSNGNYYIRRNNSGTLFGNQSDYQQIPREVLLQMTGGSLPPCSNTNNNNSYRYQLDQRLRGNYYYNNNGFNQQSTPPRGAVRQ